MNSGNIVSFEKTKKHEKEPIIPSNGNMRNINVAF